MSQTGAGGDRVPVRAAEDLVGDVKRLALLVLGEPFRKRTWADLGFFLAGSALAYVGAVVAGVLAAAGLLLSAVLVGVVVLAWGLRAARGLARWQRALAWRILGEDIPEPEPLTPRPGHFGRLRATLRDRTAWLALAYFVGRLPLTLFGVWFALSIWSEALSAVLSPLTGRRGFVPFGILDHASRATVAISRNGDFVHRSPGPTPEPLLFAIGVLVLFVAPWPTRLVVAVDRRMMQLLLGRDAVSSRVRRLEESRSRTIDAATVTLQRIERNLHDGTQAQLVALAMRLGQAKEKLEHLDAGREETAALDAVRRLVDEAHRGAKEAITDLRDLARGIHPPALETGLANALATLAARSPVPTEVTVSVPTRPTPAIEVICYFCAAELLANVHQHARASRASLACTQHGPWVRLVVRDDGRGGAVATRAASSSSGLAGLADRVRAVDGDLSIASPPGGPTVVTVDLPNRA